MYTLELILHSERKIREGMMERGRKGRARREKERERERERERKNKLTYINLLSLYGIPPYLHTNLKLFISETADCTY